MSGSIPLLGKFSFCIFYASSVWRVLSVCNRSVLRLLFMCKCCLMFFKSIRVFYPLKKYYYRVVQNYWDFFATNLYPINLYSQIGRHFKNYRTIVVNLLNYYKFYLTNWTQNLILGQAYQIKLNISRRKEKDNMLLLACQTVFKFCPILRG